MRKRAACLGIRGSTVAVALLALGGARLAFAQQPGGVVTGVVVIDSTAQGVAGATVRLLDVNRTVLTNLNGEFRFPPLKAGRHVIEVMHIGYVPVRDSIVVQPGQGLDLEIELFHLPVQLDSVTVRSTRSVHSYLDDFENRRKIGFGHFIDSVELRQHGDGRNFANYLASHFAGLTVIPKTFAGAPSYLSNGRSQCSGKAFSCGARTACLIALYIDGLPTYIPGQSPGGPPDLDALRTDEFAAVEWYPGGATVPEAYNATGSNCGVMLLWRRR